MADPTVTKFWRSSLERDEHYVRTLKTAALRAKWERRATWNRKKIADLQEWDGLNIRVWGCLWRSDIRTVAEVREKSDAELLRLRNFEVKSLSELRTFLGQGEP